MTAKILAATMWFCLGGAVVFFYAAHESEKGYQAMQAMNAFNLTQGQSCRAQLNQDEADLAQYRTWYRQVTQAQKESQANGSAALSAIARLLLKP
jgi:ribulose kinase